MKKLVAIIAVIALMTLLAGAVAWAADSPEEVYKKVNKAIMAQNFDELVKYCTAERKAKIMKTQPSERKMLLQMVKDMTPASPKLIGKKITEDTAILYFEAFGFMGNDSEKAYGKVTLLKENGEWKHSRENWTNKPQK